MYIDILIYLGVAYAGAGFLAVCRFAADRELVKKHCRNPDNVVPGFDKHIFWQYFYILLFWPTYYWR